MDRVIEVFSGSGKAAVVVNLTNTHHGGPWTLDSVSLTADSIVGPIRPFALRLERNEIVPGQSGRVAVVVDASAFENREGKLADLALQVFRGDGLLQVMVRMDHTLLRK